jgi:hypothetical protein
VFFTVRSGRLLMERLDDDLMFRWFVLLGIDDPVWDHSTFSKNRDRLLEADIRTSFSRASWSARRSSRSYWTSTSRWTARSSPPGPP